MSTQVTLDDSETVKTITLTATDHSWDNSSIISTISTNTLPYNTKHGSIHATGDVAIDGDLKIQGESIKDLLEEIKDKLAIFKPNLELEERWETLRELKRQYIKLEKDILEKEEIIRILKR